MPTFDVNAFRSSVLSRGLLKPSNFRVRIFPPTGLAAPNNIIQDLELWGEAADLPFRQLGSHQMYRHGYGAIEMRPYFPVYEPNWIVTFRVDSNGDIWRFFKNWSNLIVNSDSTGAAGGPALYEIAYKDTYLSDVEIGIFDQEGNETIHATMIEAFPISVGEIKMSWENSREYARCNIAFAYTDWVESPDAIGD